MGLDIIAITCSMRDGQDWQLNMLEHRCCGMIDVEVIEKGEMLFDLGGFGRTSHQYLERMLLRKCLVRVFRWNSEIRRG